MRNKNKKQQFKVHVMQAPDPSYKTLQSFLFFLMGQILYANISSQIQLAAIHSIRESAVMLMRCDYCINNGYSLIDGYTFPLCQCSTSNCS